MTQLPEAFHVDWKILPLEIVRDPTLVEISYTLDGNQKSNIKIHSVAKHL